jgi:hypothetical protein
MLACALASLVVSAAGGEYGPGVAGAAVRKAEAVQHPTATSARARGRVLWTADMEEGSLADWFAPERAERGDHGGGEYNSGAANSTASTEQRHSGGWAVKTVVRRAGGTRLFRWRELHANRDLRMSVWLYFPRNYRLTGDPNRGRFWNVFQFKSGSRGGRKDPFWFLNIANAPDGGMVPQLVWWPRRTRGPHRGESGLRGFVNPRVRLPVRRWFRLDARLRQSKGFDGVVQFWLDGRLIFDMRNVRTGFSNCRYNTWCVDQGWSVNNYSDGLSPAPGVIYVDDASIQAL